jgi:tetratricopeptide (TPR) repeat protein
MKSHFLIILIISLGITSVARANTPDFNKTQGLAWYTLYNADSSIYYLSRYYKTNANDDQMALALAESFLWKKDYKTSSAILEKIQNQKQVEYYRVKALLMEMAGRFDESLELYNIAIHQDSLPYGLMERKATVLKWLKRFKESEQVLREIIATPIVSPGLRTRCEISLAELLAWQKQIDPALLILKNLIKKHPHNHDALMLEAQLFEWKGNYRKAKDNYNLILSIDANHKEARLKLGKLQWVK